MKTLNNGTATKTHSRRF